MATTEFQAPSTVNPAVRLIGYGDGYAQLEFCDADRTNPANIGAFAGILRIGLPSMGQDIVDSSPLVRFESGVQTAPIEINSASGDVSVGLAASKLGFYSKAPVVQPLLATGASHTADDIITVLQALGLVKQS